MIWNAPGRPSTVGPDPTKPTGPYNRVRQRGRSGCWGGEPTVSFSDGLDRTIEWYHRTRSARGSRPTGAPADGALRAPPRSIAWAKGCQQRRRCSPLLQATTLFVSDGRARAREIANRPRVDLDGTESTRRQRRRSSGRRSSLKVWAPQLATLVLLTAVFGCSNGSVPSEQTGAPHRVGELRGRSGRLKYSPAAESPVTTSPSSACGPGLGQRGRGRTVPGRRSPPGVFRRPAHVG